MPYYEMSLEHQREYVYQNDFTVAESSLGLWLMVFLDVDWSRYRKRAEELRGEPEVPLSKFKWVRDAQRNQWELDYSQRVARWYYQLHTELSERHPLLRLLVEQQLRNLLCCEFHPEQPEQLRPEELQYLEVLDGFQPQGTQATVRPVFLRGWLSRMLLVFAQLEKCRERILPLLDQVMGGDPREEGGILRRYAALQQGDLSYRNLVEGSYPALSPRFHISSNHIIYRYDGISRPIPEGQKLEGHTYMAADRLDALTIWEFEMVCANEISLRRCAHCNRYFQPYSVVSCYCDRPVEGRADKTCKDIGAMSRHQQKVSQDEARKLYRKVCNRTQMAAQRRKEQYPDILRRYNQVQLRGKELLEQVEAGTMTFEQFQAQFDKKPGELLEIGSGR